MGKVPRHTCDKDNPQAKGCFEHKSASAWWGLVCYECFGDGSVGGSRCSKCSGTGLIGMPVCPNSVNTGTMDAIFTAWRYKQDGLHPNTGGSLDLSKTYLDACDIAESLKAKIELRAVQESNRKA